MTGETAGSGTRRLMSLDALRGANMFFIMGGAGLLSALAALWPDSSVWQWIASQMHHVSWEGFTQHDMIFPTFLFIAGAAFPFSLAKQRAAGRSNGAIAGKVILRGLILVLLGVLYNNAVNFDFAHLRYASVLGHIGLAWMFAALLTMMFGPKMQVVITAAILVGYWQLLKCFPAPDAEAGAAWYSLEGSLAGYVDRLYLPGSLYQGLGDPEGILSTLPAVGTALLGVLTGEWLRRGGVETGGVKKAALLLLAGAALIALGWFWNADFPIIKKIWTSSFVCFAGGIAMVSLAVFYWIIDVIGLKRWAFFFVVIGMNSITIYLAQRIVKFESATEFFFADAVSRVPEAYRETFGCVGYIVVCWAFLYFLYRRKIFLKV